MKYYIASSFSNREIVNETINILNGRGFINTYNWTLNNKASNELELKTIGQTELDAVKEADVLIAILPGGKGTHTEIGIALGSNKPVILAYFDNDIVSISNSATFYFIDCVNQIKVSKENIADVLTNYLLNMKD